MDYEKVIEQMIADNVISQDVAVKYVPELLESENERMKKSFIRLVKAYYDFNFPTPEGFTREEMLGWLEKQGEQKPQEESALKVTIDAVTKNKESATKFLKSTGIMDDDGKLAKEYVVDEIEPKFKVGDVIRLKGTDAEYTIKRVTDTTYFTNGWSCGIERCEEDYELVEQKPAWSEEDRKMYQRILSFAESEWGSDYDLVIWLKAFRDRVQPQSQQEWSKEDEEIRNELISYFESLTQCIATEKRHKENRRWLNWLKSLKDRDILGSQLMS